MRSTPRRTRARLPPALPFFRRGTVASTCAARAPHCDAMASKRSAEVENDDPHEPIAASVPERGTKRNKRVSASVPKSQLPMALALAVDASSRTDAEALAGAAHALDGVKLTVGGSTSLPLHASHVLVSGEHATASARLPMRAYLGAARGLWVVDAAWVFHSLAAGRWLPEEEFEIEACRAARQQRQAQKQGVLHGVVVAFWQTHLPAAALSSLVRCAGGSVVQSHRLATVLVSDAPAGSLPHALKKQANNPANPRVVGAKWLFDTVLCRNTTGEPSENAAPGRPTDMVEAEEQGDAATTEDDSAGESDAESVSEAESEVF